MDSPLAEMPNWEQNILDNLVIVSVREVLLVLLTCMTAAQVAEALNKISNGHLDREAECGRW